MKAADMIPLLAPLRAEMTGAALTVWFDLGGAAPVAVVVNTEKHPLTYAHTAAYIERIAAGIGEIVNRPGGSALDALARWGVTLNKPMPPRLLGALSSVAGNTAKRMVVAADRRRDEARTAREVAAAMDDRAAAKRLDALSDEVWARAIREFDL